MTESLKHFDEHIRACLTVFACLMVLTGVTVAVSYMDVPTAAAITIALCIASLKGTLVCLYFMHLISEKKLIYICLIFTAFFSFILLLLPAFTKIDGIKHLIERSF